MSVINNDYTWIATAGGNWSDPTNWANITTGQTPAVTAPGSLDVATLGSGSGILYQGTFTGQGTVGTLILNSVEIAADSSFDVNAGTVIYTDQEEGLSLAGC